MMNMDLVSVFCRQISSFLIITSTFVEKAVFSPSYVLAPLSKIMWA
jgi:hypothetical protein